MWKSVMDSLAGWEAPIVVKREREKLSMLQASISPRVALGTSLP